MFVAVAVVVTATSIVFLVAVAFVVAGCLLFLAAAVAVVVAVSDGEVAQWLFVAVVAEL